MNLTDSVVLYTTLVPLFVMGVMILMVVACYLTCLVHHFWHWVTKSTQDYKTLCQRISETVNAR